MLPDGRVVALSDEGRRAVLATVNQMADAALRCLAFARKSGSELGPLAAYNGAPPPGPGWLLLLGLGLGLGLPALHAAPPGPARPRADEPPRPAPPRPAPAAGDPHHPAAKQLLDPANYAGIESGMVFLGLAGLQVRGRAAQLARRAPLAPPGRLPRHSSTRRRPDPDAPPRPACRTLPALRSPARSASARRLAFA
jgi:hypothetical protein